MNSFILGTRGSALALAQTDMTANALKMMRPDINTGRQIFVTRGDQKLDLNLLEKGDAGGKGLFTRELEEALLDGTIDAAVHSLKDLPGQNPEGLEVVAVLERASVADVLISKRPGGFNFLPQQAKVGTSSVRRARQIQWLRPDLQIEEWRGNVPTRLRKFEERKDLDAIVLAEAGLMRLGFDIDHSNGILAWPGGQAFVSSLSELILPAIGQGAIAIQARKDRPEVCEVLSMINHEPTMIAVRAEREVQRLLAGDCSMPLGVRSVVYGEALILRGILFPEGETSPNTAECKGSIYEPEEVARELFAILTAD